MASLWKHPKSPYWTACYTNKVGRRLKKSTKLRDKREAMKVANQFQELEDEAKGNHLTTVQIMKVASELCKEITGERHDIPTVKVFFGEWLDAKKSKGASAGTVERYGHTVKLFLNDLGELQHAQITAIAPRHIERFLNNRLKSGSAPKTASVDIKTLRTAFNRAEKFGLILKNPVDAIELPEVTSMEREVFSHDEIRKLVTASDDFGMEWMILIAFGYYTGARLKDCAQMKWGNLDFKTGVLTYTQGKTSKVVVVPLQLEFFEMLTGLHDGDSKDDYICSTLAARGGGGSSGLSETFKRIMAKAGVDDMKGKGKGNQNFSKRSFHSLRYSFNSTLANAGVAQEVRAKLTGHTSMAMNTRYTKLNLKSLNDAIDKIPSLDKPE